MSCKCVETGEFPIKIIQGDSYRRVYKFYDVDNNLLTDDAIASVLLSVPRLTYTQILNWDEEEQGYVFILSAETTAEFPYCKGTYDVTLTFIDDQVSTQVYQSSWQIFNKDTFYNTITNNSGYLTADRSRVVIKTGIMVGAGSGGTNDHRLLNHRDADDQHPISAITGLQDELDDKQPLGDYATTEELEELANIVDSKADSDEIPTKVSDLENDSNFATEQYVDNIDDNLQDQIDNLQAEKMPLMDVDTVPTEGSTNLVESGGVYDAIDGVQQDVDEINSKIPTQASSSNQLADKNFVNSSVQTATANFRGNWNDWAEVPTDSNLYPADYAGSKIPTTNDYLVVGDASDYTAETLVGTWRFKYNGVWATNGKNGWHPEYQVNETPLTAAQLAALNSGITANKVTAYDEHIANKTNPHEVTYQQLGGTNPSYTKSETDNLLNSKQNVITDLATIRSGAVLGATAVQPETLDNYALKVDLREIGRACYNLLDKAAYIDDGTDISALKDALWALVGNTLVSISAVFTQGATVVYPSTALDSLKTMLVVTATYDDETTAEVNDYTLSGTLAEGTSTITAIYNGKTATFVVNVTAEPPAPVLDYISAVYTQSGTVYPSTALNSLKADLVVTAHMTDASTYIVDAADYTLNGTLAVGTSAVTITYEGKTTTFNITVTAEPTVITGYTSVGNPNIAGNILTPSEGNFIKTPEVFSPNGQSWEIRTKFKFTDINTDYQDVFGGVDVSNASARTILCEFSRPKLNITASSAGTAWDILETSATNPMLFDISNNTWYWLKVGFDGAKYYREYSTDGVNYSRSEKADLRTIPDGYAIGFGLKRNAVFLGNIDLTECEIDINNTPWWKAVSA